MSLTMPLLKPIGQMAGVHSFDYYPYKNRSKKLVTECNEVRYAVDTGWLDMRLTKAYGFPINDIMLWSICLN